MEQFKKICGQVLIEVSLAYRWQWDENLNVALVSFDKEREEAVLSALSTGFDQDWDFSTIAGAPEPISEFFGTSFGLFPGQKVFSCDNGSGLILLALWWPWGNGDKISLRIGMLSSGEEAADKSEIRDALMQWFAI